MGIAVDEISGAGDCFDDRAKSVDAPSECDGDPGQFLCESLSQKYQRGDHKDRGDIDRGDSSFGCVATIVFSNVGSGHKVKKPVTKDLPNDNADDRREVQVL